MEKMVCVGLGETTEAGVKTRGHLITTDGDEASCSSASVALVGFANTEAN